MSEAERIDLVDRAPLTEKQQNVYESIMQYQRVNGYAPTIREICKMVGVASTSSVYAHLKILEEKGYIAIGNPVYPPAREELAKHGIDCKGKRAVQLTKADYDKYDYILGMDHWNLKNMLRILKSDPEDKVKLLLDYSDDPRDIADPWYTGGFDVTYSDVVEGCEAFLEYLKDKKKL